MATGIITQLVTLESTECASCAVIFAVPDTFLTARRKDGAGFWCPNGHVLNFQDTEADRLRQQLEAARAESVHLADQARAARADRDAALRRAAAAKGEVTKARKRAAAALCPCCNRSFVQQRRHLKTKHPDYRPDGVR